MQHQEDYDSNDSASEDDQYFDSYGDFQVHRVMLNDGPRMNFYYHLLSDRTALSHRCVVDIGAGTGVLGMWSVQNGGASHCLSFEASPLAATLQRLVEANGLSDRMTVVARRVEDVIAEGPDAFLAQYPIVETLGGIDIVVSEWMGFYLLHESMLPSVLAARDFFRAVNAVIAQRVASHSSSSLAEGKKSIRMIPSHADISVAPVSLEPLFERDHGRYWQQVRAPGQPSSSKGLNFTILARSEFEQKLAAASPLIETVPPESLLCEGQVLTTLDLSTITAKDLEDCTHQAVFRFQANLSSSSSHESGLQGFVLWFSVSQQPEGLRLDTSPLAPPTHWKSTVLLLPEDMREGGGIPLRQLEGETMEVSISIARKAGTARGYTLSFELN